MGHVLQNRYSDMVLEKLRKSLVLKDGIIFNNDYDGDPKAGAVKIPKRDGEVEVGDYNTTTGIALSAGSTEYITLTINKDKAINEIIDGFEAQAVPDNLVIDRLISGGYSLALALDTDGGNTLISEGTSVAESSLTKDNIYSKIVDLKVAMNKDYVPAKGRYLLVTPDCEGLLLKSPEFISASNLGDEVKQTGAIGQIAGFTVFSWQDTTANLSMIAGHPKFATRVKEWKVPVGLYDLNGDSAYVGASAVKGRYVYAHKVTRPKAIKVVFSPAYITLGVTALSGADAGKYQITATATDSGTLKYKVVNNGELNKYGDGDTGFTAFTSGTTKISANSGNIIEIAEFDSDSKLIAMGLYSVQ